MKINLSEIGKGDIFSETTHYRAVGESGNFLVFKSLNTGETVELSKPYVTAMLSTPNQYTSEKTVGKEDKYWTKKQIADFNKKDPIEAAKLREGDFKEAGIKSIWDSIDVSQTFTVVFRKADIELSAKKFKELREKQIEDAIAEIEKTRKAKKGVTEKSKEVLRLIQENPVLAYERGDERTLVGRKLQFKSINGHYRVLDLNKEIPEERQVNVSTITSLILDGVKYNVE